MTHAYSKSRLQSEVAFGKVQTEFSAREQALYAWNTIAQARDENTMDLREARRATEFADRNCAASAGHGPIIWNLGQRRTGSTT